MNRMVVALLVVILGFGLFLVVQDTEETDSNEIARAEELATEMDQGEATDNSAVDTAGAEVCGTSRRRAVKSRRVDMPREKRKKKSAFVVKVVSVSLILDTARTMWTGSPRLGRMTQDAMESCRSEIKKEEGGELDFRAMKACDRSHLDALYEDSRQPR